ncbi:MAG: DUF6456 domain-containing protein, partial [Pseudomonadota bacterium]
LQRVLRAIGERTYALRHDGALVVSLAKGEVVAARSDVAFMLSEGLLANTGRGVTRTDAGRAYLRRALASAAENPAGEQHRACAPRIIADRGGAIHVTENAAESPLAWLAQRKDRAGKSLITVLQRQAGERLFCDHERAHRRPSLTASWDPTGVRSGGPRDGLTLGEAAQDARRRVEHALGAVGPGLSETLVAVCCEGLGLEALEKRFGWPARSGKVVLRLALDRLANHYGYGVAAKGAKAARGIVHWGAEGYRPTA